MKKIILICCTLFFIACNKPPFHINSPTIIYLDQANHVDTIIVQYNNEYNDLQPSIYYAKKDWQRFANAIPMNGFREFGIRTADSIYIPVMAGSTNYNSYRFKFSADGATLESQNILLNPLSNASIIFVRQ